MIKEINGPNEPNWRGKYLLVKVIKPFKYNKNNFKYLTLASSI